MKTKLILSTIFLAIVAVFSFMAFRFTEEKPVLKLSQTTALPGVKGRIDHMAYDGAGQRVFICALGNNSVEVVDVKNNALLKSIKSLKAPQGIIYLAAKKRFYVSTSEDGYLRAFDAETYLQTDSVLIGNDADNVRYDSVAKRIYVGSDIGLTMVNAENFKVIKTVELEGHPEAFQIDYGTRRMFVNVPDANEIEVIDLGHNIVAEKWGLQDSHENFPMAIDPSSHRLFIACRHPAKILVMDDQTGNILSAVSCSGDADDLFYDAETKQILVSCGEGYVDVFKEKSGNTFSQNEHISSRMVARTSLFIPSERKYFLAVPALLTSETELRTYTLIP